MIKVIQSPEVRKRMEDVDVEPIGDAPEKMARPTKHGTNQYARLVK